MHRAATLRPRGPLALLAVAAVHAACSGTPDADVPESDSGPTSIVARADAGADEPSDDGGDNDGGAGGDGHAHHAGDAGPADGGASRGPGCDEDNLAPFGMGVDRSVPDAVVQFERRYDWGCLHREYHETRQWDLLARNPQRFQYIQQKGWKRAAVQEGQPSDGLAFLAMHRAMLGTLRANFPQHAALFAGWSSPPTSATAADPLPATADGGAPPAMTAAMQRAVGYLSGDLHYWSTEDALGLYIQSDLRPTAVDPAARSTDPTAGLHAYLHARYDDLRSQIRMQRFSRNLENATFWRLHGWIDAVWTRFRVARGLGDDAADYKATMHHACMHMGFHDWDSARFTCTPH